MLEYWNSEVQEFFKLTTDAYGLTQTKTNRTRYRNYQRIPAEGSGLDIVAQWAKKCLHTFSFHPELSIMSGNPRLDIS